MDIVAETLGPEAYRALYEYGPDGVLFTVPDGQSSPPTRRPVRSSGGPRPRSAP